ncbi:hypothetical protein SAY86_029251 [Trapa natans]|uniref:Uncharacterized protein n=1 Tax=Trapa natans TaxID=22666 RepID=A0AAN7RCW3_TRANT|nr:hypothetical protein SAY86_029251 [Trapa natans]
MSIQGSTDGAAGNGGSHPVVQRCSTRFHRSVWGDYFLKYNSASMDTIREEQHIEELVKVIKKKLADADDLGKLDLIDRTQRLGIAYKFEKEIKDILQQFHDHSCSKSDAADYGHDMRNTALLFRLLRQEGYRIPACDMFNKFKDSHGKFSQALTKDVRGLLSLYEASNFRVHGENILEEALTFSVHHLQSALENDHSKTLSPGLAEEVKHALKHSIHKGLTRLEAWHYIRFYEQDASRDELEQERGHVASTVECYAKHHGMSEEESTKLMWGMIEDAWKDINEEMLSPTPVEMPLLMRILNLTRVMELLYKDKDRYTHAETETKDFVAALLVHPIPL